jgi:hypothetical protein
MLRNPRIGPPSPRIGSFTRIKAHVPRREQVKFRKHQDVVNAVFEKDRNLDLVKLIVAAFRCKPKLAQ